MRTISLYSFALFILSVSAYGDVGTYERIWFWYAYQLDESGNDIAPACARTMGTSGRCTFVQFMNYIEQGTGTSVDPSKIQNVNPLNIDATVCQVSRAIATTADGLL